MRDYVLIGGILIAAVAIGSVLFFIGPSSLQSDVITSLSSANATAPGPVPYTVLEQGVTAISITSRTNYRIDNADDFSALWSMVYGVQGARHISSAAPVPSMPAIDFSKYEVLAVFDGSHPTNGYAIMVSSIVDAKQIRTVTINHIVSDASCRASTKPSSPFELVQVPKTLYSISHHDSTSTKKCL